MQFAASPAFERAAACSAAAEARPQKHGGESSRGRSVEAANKTGGAWGSRRTASEGEEIRIAPQAWDGRQLGRTGLGQEPHRPGRGMADADGEGGRDDRRTGTSSRAKPADHSACVGWPSPSRLPVRSRSKAVCCQLAKCRQAHGARLPHPLGTRHWSSPPLCLPGPVLVVRWSCCSSRTTRPTLASRRRRSVGTAWPTLASGGRRAARTAQSSTGYRWSRLTSRRWPSWTARGVWHQTGRVRRPRLDRRGDRVLLVWPGEPPRA